MTTQLAKTTADLPDIVRERGIAPETWNAIKTSIWPDASDEMAITALEYCKARGLDPLKKPVHIVKTWDSRTRRMVDSIWPSIGELRTTAMRTGEFSGRDQTEFGPTAKFEWKEEGREISIDYPEWAQVTVYRIVKGESRPFPGPRVYWKEAFASKKGGAPNAMWQKRPFGQLDKCAEAAALRSAFPEEIGNMNSSDEMAGQDTTPIPIKDEPMNAEEQPKSRPKAPKPGGVAAATQKLAEKPVEQPEEPKPEPTNEKKQPEPDSEPETPEAKPDEAIDAEFEEEESEPDPPPEPVTPETLDEGQTVECRGDIGTIGSPKQMKNGTFVTKVDIVSDQYKGACFIQHQEPDPPFHPGASILGTVTGAKTTNGTRPMCKLGEWRIAK